MPSDVVCGLDGNDVMHELRTPGRAPSRNNGTKDACDAQDDWGQADRRADKRRRQQKALHAGGLLLRPDPLNAPTS